MLLNDFVIKIEKVKKSICESSQRYEMLKGKISDDFKTNVNNIQNTCSAIIQDVYEQVGINHKINEYDYSKPSTRLF